MKVIHVLRELSLFLSLSPLLFDVTVYFKCNRAPIWDNCIKTSGAWKCLFQKLSIICTGDILTILKRVCFYRNDGK